MASKTPVVTVTDEDFPSLVERYQELKRQEEAISKEKDEILASLETYTNVDKGTPFEGNVRLVSGSLQVTLEFKNNHRIDTEEAMRLVNLKGLDPTRMFNVRYDFSKTKAENLAGEEYKVYGLVHTFSRGKTGIKIKENK